MKFNDILQIVFRANFVKLKTVNSWLSNVALNKSQTWSQGTCKP